MKSLYSVKMVEFSTKETSVGYFSEQDIEIRELHRDGVEPECIARSVGCRLLEVEQVIYGDPDYDIGDMDIEVAA